jgi:hypothetical protein
MSDMTVQALAGLPSQTEDSQTLWQRMRFAWQQREQAGILNHVDDRLRADAGLPRASAATTGFTITTSSRSFAVLTRRRAE